MLSATQLQPITGQRASELFGMLQTVQHDENKAIALDARGRATGVVDIDDPSEEHLLGDLDVHA